jgi:branched-chain amino acid aminotransferase
MPIQTTSKIWHNGNLIPWEKANIHVMSHVIHYGSSVFEGIRCYGQPSGAAVFRLPEHMQRLLDSAKIYRMPLPYSLDQLSSAVVDLIEANGVAPCYIRPIAFRGYGEIGVNPKHVPVEVYMANFPWGKYVAGDAADVCISSWQRLAPNTMPSLAKAGGNYLNSQLIRMEADANGYVEGIALDVNGYLSEGSGENLFLVRNGVLYTTPLANSVLSGITRDSVLTLACSTSPMKYSSPEPPLKSRPSAASTASSSPTATPDRSPNNSPMSSSASPTACGPTATAG